MIRLLVVLLLLFMVMPFMQHLPHPQGIELVMLTAVTLTAVLALDRQPHMLKVGFALMAPALLGKAVLLYVAILPMPLRLLATAAYMAFYAYVVARLFDYILRSPKVNASVVCAGVSGYLLLGLLWVPLYVVIARLLPESFAFAGTPLERGQMDGFNAIYFSFITLCTVGYGDFSPVSNAARLLVIFESIAGLFYMGIIIARIVAVFTSAPAESSRHHSRP